MHGSSIRVNVRLFRWLKQSSSYSRSSFAILVVVYSWGILCEVLRKHLLFIAFTNRSLLKFHFAIFRSWLSIVGSLPGTMNKEKACLCLNSAMVANMRRKPQVESFRRHLACQQHSREFPTTVWFHRRLPTVSCWSSPFLQVSHLYWHAHPNLFRILLCAKSCIRRFQVVSVFFFVV